MHNLQIHLTESTESMCEEELSSRSVIEPITPITDESSSSDLPKPSSLHFSNRFIAANVPRGPGGVSIVWPELPTSINVSSKEDFGTTVAINNEQNTLRGDEIVSNSAASSAVNSSGSHSAQQHEIPIANLDVSVGNFNWPRNSARPDYPTFTYSNAPQRLLPYTNLDPFTGPALNPLLASAALSLPAYPTFSPQWAPLYPTAIPNATTAYGMALQPPWPSPQGSTPSYSLTSTRTSSSELPRSRAASTSALSPASSSGDNHYACPECGRNFSTLGNMVSYRKLRRDSKSKSDEERASGCAVS